MPFSSKSVDPGKISHHQAAVFGHSVVIFGGIVGAETTQVEALEFD